MTLATADYFTQPDPVRYHQFPLAGTELEVRIRSLSDRELSAYRLELMDKSGEVTARNIVVAQLKLIALCVVDADGKRLMNGDASALADKDSRVIRQIADECQKHVGLDRSEIEALVGNFEETGD